jgi:hypothetical protein
VTLVLGQASGSETEFLPSPGATPNKELVHPSFLGSRELLDDLSQFVDGAVRDDQDTRVPGQVYLASNVSLNFVRPPATPGYPCLVQRSEVTVVMGDERLLVISGKAEDLDVGQAEAAKLPG